MPGHERPGRADHGRRRAATSSLSEWIDQVAIDTALAGNRDGFSVAGANFRLYHDTGLNKLRLIVLGPDDTFVPERLPEPELPAARARRGLPGREPATSATSSSRSWWATPRGLGIYQATVRKLRTGVLAAGTVKQRVDALWTIVGPRAKADPLRIPDYDAEQSKDAIKEYVDRRWQALEQAGF